MRTLFRTWLAFSAMAMAQPGAADAQDSSAFDGIYAGVSIVGTGAGKCQAAGSIPRPLRISDGRAYMLMGANAELVFDGRVNSDGSFVLKDDAGTPMTGGIDAMGAVTASVPDIRADCTYLLTWRWSQG
jgi:hypothetical protein